MKRCTASVCSMVRARGRLRDPGTLRQTTASLSSTAPALQRWTALDTEPLSRRARRVNPRRLRARRLAHFAEAVRPPVRPLRDAETQVLNSLVGALRMEWPRIPLPGWPDGDEDGAADELAASAARGRELAALLDSDSPVPGITTGRCAPETAAIAVPSTVDGRNMTGEDFALTAGWGHFGQSKSVMPGQGRIVERPYTADERAVLGEAVRTLGETTFDVHLNDRAYWRNVPAAVWSYKLGGYQVLKKWLSYREHKVLGRSMMPEEVQHFTDTARRIAAILRLTA